MTKIILHALHGFLGQTSDWDFLKKHYTIVAHDLYHDIRDLKTWAQAFNGSISMSENNVLLGYSLGGRLALHALVDQPNLWKQAIIISAHPGLRSGKEERLQQDKNWALRFLKDPWKSLVQEWNNQDIFCGVHSPFVRYENQFKREYLSKMLIHYSISHQNDLTEQIANFSHPILWIAGEKDIRYKSLALAQSFRNSQSRVWVAPNAGHRVPWEQTESFCDELHSFLGENHAHNNHRVANN